MVDNKPRGSHFEQPVMLIIKDDIKAALSLWKEVFPSEALRVKYGHTDTQAYTWIIYRGKKKSSDSKSEAQRVVGKLECWVSLRTSQEEKLAVN